MQMTEPQTSGSANERTSAEAESAARAPNENIRPVLEIIQEVREDGWETGDVAA